MEYESIYESEYETCNKFVLKANSTFLFFITIVYILNVLQIFIVKQYAMNIIMICSVLLFGGPVVIYFFKKAKIFSGLYYAYISATCMLLNICILYSFLTFHVILMFLFPAVIYMIYGNNKLIHYVVYSSMVIMVISHILSCYLGVNPEEPFTDMHNIIVFGLLPKLLIYAALMYAFLFESRHHHQMLRRVVNYSEDMRRTQEELVKAFAEICEAKSGQTGKHVKRVSLYVDIMAQQLGIQNPERECLAIASMMHDVGKLKIPTDILDKEGKLTDDEYAAIKKHTEYGYELLKNSPGRTMELATQIALQHHERYDGHGYEHIQGDKIDYYSRIVAIADVFDALVSNRSYKEKWDPQKAYDIIIEGSGTQFDPQLVEVFKKCYPKFLQVLEQHKN
jgi:hypothetical protein